MNHNNGRAADSPPDADNNLGRGAPDDREERIQQKRRNEARSIDQDPQYRNRRPHDLDREDAELHREGAAEEKPVSGSARKSAAKSKDTARRCGA